MCTSVGAGRLSSEVKVVEDEELGYCSPHVALFKVGGVFDLRIRILSFFFFLSFPIIVSSVTL